jgi:hypothetical protein
MVFIGVTRSPSVLGQPGSGGHGALPGQGSLPGQGELPGQGGLPGQPGGKCNFIQLKYLNVFKVNI